ncbi:methyl-accepting chemotaxis protein [Salinimonas chungwhensis]|uniref:methyl-accepting chemotaxis protein n=1 Tax=Salinimonas chungwhensis TaxID=265425 RepID=UPI000A05E6C1|nr:methyl-accepting chemotaxis protein [Salinimonas chungwhensis]
MINTLAKTTVRNRLALGFGTILALMIVLTILGINKVNFIDRTLAQMTDINAVKQRYAINYRGSVHDRAIAVRDIAIAQTASQVTEFEDEIRTLEAFYATSESEMNVMIKDGIEFTDTEFEILQRIKAIQAVTKPLIEQIINSKKMGEPVEALVLEKARPAFITWLNTINQFIDYQETQNKMATPEARKVAGGFQNLMLLLSGLAIAISILVAFLIERSLRASLGGEPFNAQKFIKTMADGDLTQPVQTNHQGSVIDSLADMNKTITGIVINIKTASNNLLEQIFEVTKSSEKVLLTAKDQARLTSQTAIKLDTMRGSIDEVSNIARHTQENSGLTVSYAKEGREVVGTMAAEMTKVAQTVDVTVSQIKTLEENTKKIGGIANVISEISEQTNLLALNAAIEAARAGESGRGFAVVADEVRHLAKRTREATSQIEVMVSDVQAQTAASVQAMETTQPQVENSKAQTRKATTLLENIEQQADDSLAQVQKVAQSTADQVTAVADITQAMVEIAEMSKNSMNNMSENDHAAHKLNELAIRLKQEVKFFKV